MIRPLLAIAGVLSSAAAAQATMITSFENSADGWYVNGDAYPINFSTEHGVTHGTYSAAIDLPGAWSNSLRAPLTTDLLGILSSGDAVTLDVTYNGMIPDGAQLQFTLQMQGAYNGIGFNFSMPTSITTSGTHTLTFPYGENVDFPDGAVANWGDLRLITNPAGGFGDPAVTYFDSFQTVQVPEPLAPGLLAVGGLLSLRRRRGA